MSFDSHTVFCRHKLPFKARAIINTVIVSIHLCIIICIMSDCKLNMKVKELETVSRVALVESPPNDNTAPSEFPGKNPEPPKDFPLPGELDDIPQMQQEKLPPQPRKQQQKTIPQPKVKPKPKQQPKQQPKVKTPLQPVKKSPEKTVKAKKQPIFDPSKIKLQPASAADKKSSSQNTRPNKNTGNAYSALADSIRQGIKNGQKGGTGRPGGAGGHKTESELARFYASVIQKLKNEWEPYKPRLNGNPIVRVYFDIDAAGNIISYKIEECGIGVMDNSVRSALKRLKRFTAPPGRKPIKFYVDMKIRDY